jgi:hypothetical protein
MIFIKLLNLKIENLKCQFYTKSLILKPFVWKTKMRIYTKEFLKKNSFLFILWIKLQILKIESKLSYPALNSNNVNFQNRTDF